MSNRWIQVRCEESQLVGPFRCSGCNGLLMADANIIDQADGECLLCPYCRQWAVYTHPDNAVHIKVKAIAREGHGGEIRR